MITWSPTTGGFYHAEIHGDGVPDDAVPITALRHKQLLAGQAAGRAIVAGADGKPESAPAVVETAASLRAYAIIDIKAEARRRILAIASLERQANDNAALAMRDWTKPGPSQEVAAAMERRARINAVRAASNQIEATVATLTGAALSGFVAGNAFEGLLA